ncbi:Uncharacterised protein [Vibrio cholerae]|nr:Uncharacterised protein [Vibrio cholerae]CSI56838.1 Uncharacterised protein [Vibrio cholerae]
MKQLGTRSRLTSLFMLPTFCLWGLDRKEGQESKIKTLNGVNDEKSKCNCCRSGRDARSWFCFRCRFQWLLPRWYWN